MFIHLVNIITGGSTHCQVLLARITLDIPGNSQYHAAYSGGKVFTGREQRQGVKGSPLERTSEPFNRAYPINDNCNFHRSHSFHQSHHHRQNRFRP